MLRRISTLGLLRIKRRGLITARRAVLLLGSIIIALHSTAALAEVPTGVSPVSSEPRGLDPELVQAIRQSPSGRADGIVFLEARADLNPAFSITNWKRRGQFVLNTLQRTAKASQADLLRHLDAQIEAGEVKESTPYYIVNAVFVRGGTLKGFRSIARFPGVRYVEKNKVFPLPEPPDFQPEPELQSTVAWGVTKIGADQAWSTFNARGQGIVVANIDTGVRWNHPALVHQYRGTTTGNHNYNWFDPTGTFPTAPGDNNNHGTHTMGTMVGDDGAGQQIGVAPAAQWIAAKGCAGNTCAQNHLIAAGQWILAPTNLAGNLPNPAMRPRVVNNSWGSCVSNNTWYQWIVQAWLAADIFPAFSAGNNCTAVGSPGSYPESFASGATDSNDVAAGFSAPGPSPLTSLTKPDVSAPGVRIFSSLANGGYGMMDGTSMASPHTAGCAALILSHKPSLPVYQVEKLLAYTSVDLGPGGPDNKYGIGRINCYSAVAWSDRPWWHFQWGSGAGQIALWNMNNGDKYVAGDYDGDGRDELLAVSTTGWAHLMRYTGSGWQFFWGTGPNGQIALWNINPGDKFVAGDFNNDGRDDVLAVSTTGWAHVMRWNGSSWQWLWGTGPNGQIGLWYINPGDKFVAGDFNNDGRDDVLAVSTTGWAHIMTWNGPSWQWLWGTGPNGQIGLWSINPGDRFFTGDFDGDGRDEVLAVSTTGWSHLMKWNGSSWQWLWGTGPNGQIGLWYINTGDRYAVGDYDADGRDELVAFSAGGWSHLMRWTGSGWQWLWGNAGASQIALWNMNPPDQFFAGNFDATDGRDELLAIKKPWVHLMYYGY